MTQEHPEQPGKVPIGELKELVEEWDVEIGKSDELAQEIANGKRRGSRRFPEGHRSGVWKCKQDLEELIEPYE